MYGGWSEEMSRRELERDIDDESIRHMDFQCARGYMHAMTKGHNDFC